jgi:hypothetical protein
MSKYLMRSGARASPSCPDLHLRWGAWYLQSHRAQCRRTGQRPDRSRISLGCTASPTSKAG